MVFWDTVEAHRKRRCVHQRATRKTKHTGIPATGFDLPLAGFTLGRLFPCPLTCSRSCWLIGLERLEQCTWPMTETTGGRLPGFGRVLLGPTQSGLVWLLV
eukprot:scaffold67917_cov17-Prasinocladus_malaysianus.AAC.1